MIDHPLMKTVYAITYDANKRNSDFKSSDLNLILLFV